VSRCAAMVDPRRVCSLVDSQGRKGKGSWPCRLFCPGMIESCPATRWLQSLGGTARKRFHHARVAAIPRYPRSPSTQGLAAGILAARIRRAMPRRPGGVGAAAFAPSRHRPRRTVWTDRQCRLIARPRPTSPTRTLASTNRRVSNSRRLQLTQGRSSLPIKSNPSVPAQPKV